MAVAEFLIKCPACLSEIRLLAQEANPLMLFCSGCRRWVVIHGSVVYTVSGNFFKKLLDVAPVEECGNIFNMSVSEEAVERAQREELHKLLDQRMDVADFLKKISE